MSLATRCPSCDTVFRVVQDQLKVSEGWVRCGRCDAVFNALEGLFDLEPSMTAAQAARGTASRGADANARSAIASAGDSATGQVTDGTAATADGIAQVTAGATNAAPREPVFVEYPPEPYAAQAHPTLHDATPASRVDEQDRIDFADARFNIELLAEAGMATGDSGLDSTPAPAAPAGHERIPAADAAPAETPQVAEPPAPEFLRRAERQARWSGPRARLGLALASVLLLATLAAQVALHYRDLAVTLFPQARPALQALCDLAGCRIEPLRRIDDIVIESSALNALPGGEAVRLTVVLRNRGVFPLALPAIELTLTDGGGQMIARRILTPAEFGAGAAPILPAAAEAPLQLVLTTSGRRASGYTVEPFYP